MRMAELMAELMSKSCAEARTIIMSYFFDHMTLILFIYLMVHII